MGMSIDIDKSIKELSKWRKDLNYDNGDYCYGDDTTRYSLDVAIDTMRKYQKMQADYENRLKADMVAMLTDIQLEIEELRLDRPLMSRGYECYGHKDKTPTEIQQECSDIIQQKIDALKEIEPQKSEDNNAEVK